MKTILVLAMHGMTPKDYPLEEKKEFLRLHSQVDAGGLSAEQRRRHDELDLKMRRWPRTPQNDPYHTAATELAREMARSSGNEVILGYNEFCAPSLQEAFALAAEKRPDKVVVVTPMMTRGGNHSEEEIPAEVQTARERFPHIQFDYAWPFDPAKIADFLTGHVQRGGF
jgi:sirohydrochlorin cobaltochelatase